MALANVIQLHPPVTAESFADEQIRKHGLPKSLELQRAILEMVFSAGAIHGALNAHSRLDAAFKMLDAKVPA